MDRKDNAQLMTQLRHDALLIAERFGLNFQSLEAERPTIKSRYGICYADGLIKIRLHHVRTGKPLKYSSLIDTLCHELAHLRHFNHGPEFKAFFWQILNWARSQGIYRPKSRRIHRMAQSDSEGVLVGEDLRPIYRNGVPVFVTTTENKPSCTTPWERRVQDPLVETREKPRGDLSANGSTLPQRISREQASRKQLNLF
ncbi:MAG: Wss1p-related putative metallopeptidase [Pseudomonadota bacterium]